MDVTTLEKANSLNRLIRDLSQVLHCFEYKTESGEVISLNPNLIIEYDDDGREQMKVPMSLSTEFIKLLKSEIEKELKQNVDKFNNL